mmetsp:Transcript_59318/g.139719  ORF Transcript_59318/g.139719 Transcript_59318/m.139719 type:complete len:211 (+) Transcript_59318:2027-2659(+)
MAPRDVPVQLKPILYKVCRVLVFGGPDHVVVPDGIVFEPQRPADLGRFASGRVHPVVISHLEQIDSARGRGAFLVAVPERKRCSSTSKVRHTDHLAVVLLGHGGSEHIRPLHERVVVPASLVAPPLRFICKEGAERGGGRESVWGARVAVVFGRVQDRTELALPPSVRHRVAGLGDGGAERPGLLLELRVPRLEGSRSRRELRKHVTGRE